MLLILILLISLIFLYTYYSRHYYKSLDFSFILVPALIGIGVGILSIVSLYALSKIWENIGAPPILWFFSRALIPPGYLLIACYSYFQVEKNPSSVLDASFIGVLFGFGTAICFGVYSILMEPTYAFGAVAAVPLFSMTGSVLGEASHLYRYSNPKNNPNTRYTVLIIILLAVWLLFWIFALSKGVITLLVLFVLGISFVYSEFKLTKARIAAPSHLLDMLHLAIDDHELFQRYDRYENWLEIDQGKYTKQNIAMVKPIPRNNYISAGIMFLVAIVGIFIATKKADLFAVTTSQLFGIWVVVPIFLSAVGLFGFILNHEFFKIRPLPIPFFTSVYMEGGPHRENSVIFEITSRGFFAPLEKAERFRNPIKMEFWIGGVKFKNVKGEISWLNAIDEDNRGAGALCRFQELPWDLYLYWHYKKWSNSLRKKTK
jgi:hypothetical protein